MTPTFIGYFAKRIVKRAREGSFAAVRGFPVGPPVDEICSVSGCIAKAPEGWRDHEHRRVGAPGLQTPPPVLRQIAFLNRSAMGFP